MTTTHMARRDLACYLDHSLLKPEATYDDIVELCQVAAAEHVATVCVSSSWVGLAATELAGTDVGVSAVVGFPSGAHRVDVKVAELTAAIADGATELDVVLNLGNVHSGDWVAVQRELDTLRTAAGATPIKLILEVGTLEDEQVVELCRLAVGAGIATVKTSTGFHPTGGATVERVRLMAATVGPAAGVKAAGGIRTCADALAMIDAGATRIGCSATVAILDGLSAQ